MAAGQVDTGEHDVRIFDAQAKNMPKDYALFKLSLWKPDLAVVWCTTPSIYSDKEFAEDLRRMVGCKVFLVGPHVSAEPENTLKDTRFIDGILMGEFDETVVDLANGVPIEECKGIARKENGDMVLNKPRMPLDVNKLAMPSWNGVDIHDYPDGGKRFPFLTMVSDRGCYNSCTFCNEQYNISKGPWRRMSVERVLDEVEYDYRIFNNKIKEIMFEADTMIGAKNTDFLEEFCNQIDERNLKFTWSGNARGDIDDEQLLNRLRKRGLRMLCVGYEFGSQQLLDKVKKNVTIDEMKNFAKATRKVGIEVNGCFMFGAPGETHKTCKQTIDFAKELNPTTAQFSAMTPYPGTPFYYWAKRNGYITAKDWSGWVEPGTFEQATLISYPNLTKNDINSYINQGLKEFYGRTSKKIELITSIRGYSDVKRMLHGIKAYRTSTSN